MARSDRWLTLIRSLKIRARDRRIIPLHFNYPQERLWQIVAPRIDRLEPIRLIVLKARREGISTAVESLLMAFIASAENVQALVTAHMKKPARDIWGMSKRFVMTSPLLSKVSTIGNNTITIGHSRLQIATAGSPESERGGDLTAAHFSEASFYPHAGFLTAAMQALPHTKRIFSIGVIESTANGMEGVGEDFYNEWTRAEEGESEWIPLFLAWHEFPEYTIDGAQIEQATPEECALRERFEVTDGQLAWRRHTIANACKGEASIFHAEYPSTAEEAFVQSGLPFFSPEQLLPLERDLRKGIVGTVEPDGRFTRAERGYLEVFKMPEPGHSYVVGADSCLPGDQVLVTDRGPLAIEDIQKTDRLLSADGEWTDIVVPMRGWFTGTLVGIRPMGVDSPVWMTPEHPVLVAPVPDASQDERDLVGGQRLRHWSKDAQWVKADQVAEGMLLRIPDVRPTALERNALMGKWPAVRPLVASGGGTRRNPWAIPSSVTLTPDFWWLVGLYLAEGYRTCAESHGTDRWIRRVHRIAFCLNPDGDATTIGRLTRIILGFLGRSPSTVVRERHTCEIVFNSEQLCEFLEPFGHRAHGKVLPEWVFSIPEECRSELFHGYMDGDGCTSRKGVNCVSVSLGLLRGFQRLLLSLGVFSSVHRLRPARQTRFPGGRWSNTRETWQLRVMPSQSGPLPWLPRLRSRRTTGGARFDGRYIWIKVGAIQRRDYMGYVYNFETKANNYCAPWMTLHNSMGIPDQEGKKQHSRSGAEVIDMDTLEQVAEYDGASAPHVFAKHLVGIGRMYNEALLAPEVQSSGGGGGREVLVYVRAMDYWNLHQWKGDPDKIRPQDSVLYGWETNSKTRPRMLARLREVIMEKSVTIHSRRLYKQLAAFGENDSGHVEALAGRDDLLFAYGIALMSWSENWYRPVILPAPAGLDPDWDGLGIHVRKPENPQDRMRRLLAELGEPEEKSFLEL